MSKAVSFCIMMLLGGACAQQNIITHVNQLPLFSPSLLRYATSDGTLPVEIYGPLPTGVSVEQLIQEIHLPAGFAITRLMLSPPGAADTDGRLVLVFHPHFQTHPERICDAAQDMQTGAGPNVRALVGFCAGNRLAASGQVRIPAAKANPVSVTRSINVLLSVMLERRPDDGLFAFW